MNFPPFFYSLRFWEALSYAIAGVLWLLVFFGVLTPEWALAPSALLTIFLGVLKWFGVEPELRLRRFIKEFESTLTVKRNKK